MCFFIISVYRDAIVHTMTVTIYQDRHSNILNESSNILIGAIYKQLNYEINEHY